MTKPRTEPGVVCYLALTLFACQARPGADAKTASEDVARDTAAPTTRATVQASPASPSLQTAASAPSQTVPGEPTTTNLATPTGSTVGASAAVPPLLDDAGNPLPQTEDAPTTTSASLQRRLEALVRAIAEDEPGLASTSFFPVEAYKQVKAIAKPEQDWKRRLVAAFERNIHDYHRQLGSAAPHIRFSRIEVPAPKVKWMKPGSEGNRVGYFRVVRSKLIVAKADGSETALEVTSMISWRGEWYVVHLHGFE
jgi:hypothetical protein